MGKRPIAKELIDAFILLECGMCKKCKYINWPRAYYPCRNCRYAYESMFEEKRLKEKGENE